ncbi:MAG TPA: hypothetical protein VGO55_11040 [Allosphingosinicella sp.]|jgi:hypothetical protein|nr:hypothetical protein [Allosphingosinicella sp.]
MKPLLCIEHEPHVPGRRDRQVYVEGVNALEKFPREIVATMDVQVFELDFYEDVELGVLTSPRLTPSDARLCFLRQGQRTWWLDGSSLPIHQVNALADLRIEQGNVLEYLAFFCFFVRGDDGPFFVVDRTDNPFVPPSPKRSEIFENFRQPKIWGQDGNGDWRLSALIYYGDAVFDCPFVVSLSGMIDMLSDFALVPEMGARIAAPLDAEGVLAG